MEAIIQNCDQITEKICSSGSKHAGDLLRDDEVHIWLINFQHFGHSVGHYFSLLSASEKQKAKRFRFDRHRKPYIIFHGVMRKLLSTYLVNVEAKDIEYQTIHNGKPILQPKQNPQNIHFNLSHSLNLALLAMCKSDVGVDIELISPSINIDELVKHYYTAGEATAIAALPSSQRQRSFYKIWARKESYMKFTGLGLSLEANSFEVSSPSNRVTLLQPNAVSASANCTVQDITLPEAHQQFAACVATGTALTIKTFLYSPQPLENCP